MDDHISITINELARRTGLSRTFLYEEKKAGRLPTLKVGSRRLVLVADAKAYLEAHRDCAA